MRRSFFIIGNLGCGNKKVAKLLEELETDAKLIERVKVGFNKPNRIYVKNFLSVVSKAHVHTCQKDTIGSVEMTPMEVSKGHTNNTDINNTEFSDNKLIVSEKNRAQEYKDGRDMANELLRRSRILVVCGEADTEEMLEDIALAKRLRIAATTLEGILTIDNKAALSKPKKR